MRDSSRLDAAARRPLKRLNPRDQNGLRDTEDGQPMADAERTPGFATLAIHAGAQPDPTTGARATPIYQTTSFVFDDVDHAASLFGLQTFGNIYTRIGNPTNAVLEERVAALEGGTAGLAVASGHAAQVLVMHALMKPGDEFVASKKLYGGSINQFNHASRISAGTWCGPTRRMSLVRDGDHAEDQGDLHRVDRQSGRRHHRHRGGRQHRAQGRRAADRRQHAGHALSLQADRLRRRHRRAFAHQVPRRPRQLDRRHDRRRRHFNWSRDRRYPMLSEPRPEYHGIVLHETFGNFAFAIACRVLGLRDMGPALSPFNAFLILTGIETLPLRMQRHCDNALAVAEWLSKQPKVAWVSYPGLPGDRYHALAKKYVPKGAGAVFTFGLKGGYDAGVKLVSNVKLFSHLANIGDTRSLIIHPASTTHRQLSDAQKVRAGAGPDVVRLSIGLEDKDDIIADLEQASQANVRIRLS